MAKDTKVNRTLSLVVSELLGFIGWAHIFAIIGGLAIEGFGLYELPFQYWKLVLSLLLIIVTYIILTEDKGININVNFRDNDE